MNIRAKKSKTYLDEIDVLKGIAIIGVIILHMYFPLVNNSIHNILKIIFVQFSMPIFMFASGLLFGFSRSEISSFSNYITFVTKKFKRIIVPYLVLSGFIIIIKYFAS